MRLAELDLLTDDERATIAEQANEARLLIGGPGEYFSDTSLLVRADVGQTGILPRRRPWEFGSAGPLL